MGKTESGCHCGQPEPYRSCCGRYIEGGEWPASAESLMRSRYSAFVVMDEAYLLATWHPSTRPSRVSLDPQLNWLDLSIKATAQGGAEDDHGTVEFVARCKRDGKAQRLHEISRFERIDGRWYYLDGEHVG